MVLFQGTVDELAESVTDSNVGVFGTDTVDARDYTIKIYYDSDDDIAKQAAETDNSAYRLLINENGRYSSILISKAEVRADDVDAGFQNLSEAVGNEGGVTLTAPDVQ